MNNQLHLLGVAHTIPHEDYLVCAFTAKVLLFPEVIQPFGWHVVEYSNEGSASAAREHVVILSKDRLRALSKRQSRDEPLDADVHNTELQQEYQQIMVEKIRSRARPGDIVCHVYGPNMGVYDALPECRHVEICVGYTASPGLPFRMYESSAWMHWHYGKAGQEDGNHYRWVIPSPIDVDSWVFCEEPDDYAIFLGRVTQRKGMNELVEIARRMPELPVHVYGPGDTAQWAASAPPNLIFKGPVFGAARVEVVRRARCMLMPTVFIEPFGNSGIEAQLCGVPLIGSSFGAFQETILEGVSGYRCHTLADWVAAIRLSGSLDRRRISTLARAKYAKEEAGKKYDWALRQLADLSDRGWYGEVSRKFAGAAVPAVPRKPRMWLYMPYFGAFPPYFQLYLDSLGRNADCLSVFLLTDIDLSGYRLPKNLIAIPMTLDVLRAKAARLIGEAFGVDLPADGLLKEPYKLVDFKIMYPAMFHDIAERHGVTEADFVGWGDCDLIYGRLADFLDLEQDYQIIGGYHGHLTAVRNIEPFRMLFKAVTNLPELLADEKSYITDEIAFRRPLLEFLERNQYQMFYTNRYFCDVVPECFFGLVRADHAGWEKNFFDTHHADKNIDHVYYDRDGGLTVVYDDGDRRPAIYCHLQKRAMSLDFERSEDGYCILEDSFRLGPPAGRENAGGDPGGGSFGTETSMNVAPEVVTGLAGDPVAARPRFFFCCGQHGSGSTWTFNLVREICRAQGMDFMSCHRESRAMLPLDDLGARLLVVKSQNPMDDLLPFIANSAEPATITVRDPRDAVVSVMQRFSNSWASSFDEALSAIVLSAQRLVALSRLRELPVFRYEDGFVGSVETFDRIAALLGTSPTEDQRAAILAGMTPEAVKRKISDLEAAGAIRGEEVWDAETHWHANHVGDGAVGKFDGVLSAARQREIITRTREYCERFGYDVTIDEAPETEAPPAAPGGAIPAAGNLGSLGEESFAQQHAVAPRRWLHSRLKTYPRVMLAVFVEDSRESLPLFFECIDALDYPKSSIVLDVRANEAAEAISRDWLARVGHLYHAVEFAVSDFSVPGRVRQPSIRRTLDLACEFWFVADVETFIRPQTLRELVALDLPIAAPFLRATSPGNYYSNYHAETDNNGYYKECDQYRWLLERRVRGVVEVPVVNRTYLVRADVIPEVTFQDATRRHDYVIFSDSARKAGIPQYLDNRQVYGYVGGGGQDVAGFGGAFRAAESVKRRVVWRRPGAIGDILMTLHLVTLYKEKYPGDWLIYQAAPSIANMLRPVMLEAGVDEVVTTEQQVACDKRVDLMGYPAYEGHPETPMARHLLEYFSEEVGLLGHYGELKLKPPERTIEAPYVTLHATSGWSMYKNWPLDRWAWVCGELKKRGIRVVQIGGPGEQAVEGVAFNRLGVTFAESLGLVANAASHVGIDSWSNHATNIVWEGKGKVPGVILWGASQLSATGYSQNRNISLGLPCQPCFRDDPKVSRVPRGVCPNPAGQVYERPLHACMHGISQEHVLEVIVARYAEGLGGRALMGSAVAGHEGQFEREAGAAVGMSSRLVAPVEGRALNQPVSRTRVVKTLVFCTAFAATQEIWTTRYRRWLSAIRGSTLLFDQIVMIDDGSPTLPNWEDVEMLPADSEIESDKPVILFHFPDNLGRWPGHNYPGWYRSYAFAAEYGKRHGFEKVIHVESDSFLIGDSVPALFNQVEDEWIALWDAYYEMPEAAIQVAAGTGLDSYYATTRRPYSSFVDQVIEHVLPFTQVIKNFTGGKYPTYLNYVPSSAEYVVQATEDYPFEYFWWLPSAGRPIPTGGVAIHDATDDVLTGSFGAGGEEQTSRIYTSHDTVVYVDESTWELRHGPRARSPANVCIVHNSNHGEVRFISDDGDRSIIFTATHSRIDKNNSDDRREIPVFHFELVNIGDGRVGLRSGQRWLCAEMGGAIVLNREERHNWETFRLSTGPSQLPAKEAIELDRKLASCLKHDRAGGPHTGVPYLEFMKLLSSHMNPRSYLEIGTATGASLQQFDCDALCIDPAFDITHNVLLNRRRTFFFQKTSDSFFAETDPRVFFPQGVDVGFLDGLHHFEVLLRDFINFERCSHENSVVLLHDCLPTDLVETSRTLRWGGWTGDVWQILPALKKYRPDLKILLLDCPPTGLVACYGLDANSTVLQDGYREIVAEFSGTALDESGLRELRSAFPLVDTRKLVDANDDIGLIFGRHPESTWTERHTINASPRTFAQGRSARTELPVVIAHDLVATAPQPT